MVIVFGFFLVKCVRVYIVDNGKYVCDGVGLFC